MKRVIRKMRDAKFRDKLTFILREIEKIRVS